MIFRFSFLAFVISAVIALPAFSSPRGDLDISYGKLPLSFVENRGQVDEQAKFVIRGPRGSAFFANDGVVFDLRGKSPDEFQRELFPLFGDLRSTARAGSGDPRTAGIRDLLGSDRSAPAAALRVRFVDADPDVRIQGWGELPGKVSYLIGNDPSKWKTDIPTYRGVIYRNVWPGIDVIYKGDSNRLKYDIRVAPGADLSQIRLRYEGAEKLWLDDLGALHVPTAVTDFVEKVPGIYQEDLTRAGGYVLVDEETVGFRVEGYDPSLPLVIDPASDLVYSTFLGGSNSDDGYGIAIDSSGCAYLTGNTDSSDFPTTPGAFDTSFNGLGGYCDVFVTKLNASGSALIYSTFLGGSDLDYGEGVAVDSNGCAYVTGYTESSNFPRTPGAFDTSFNGGYWDAFVTKLNAAGSALLYSTFLGGSSFEYGCGIAVDSINCAYVTGNTDSSDFPTTPGAFDTSYNGGYYDVFVTKLNAAGSSLLYSTFLGGSSDEEGNGIAVDSSGCAYVTGRTSSSDFPTTPAAFDTSSNGSYDAFLTKLDAAGAAMVYSTFLGGSSSDDSCGIAVGLSGCAYVTGWTWSCGFPTTPGAFDTNFNGVLDAFVTKLNADGAALVYSTFLGGSSTDCGYGTAVDSSGCAYVTGVTYSSDFPTTPGAFDTSFNGNYRDAFVTKLNAAGSALLYSAFIGGSDDDCGYGTAVDSSGCAYVAGYTESSSFPTTSGAFDTSFNGGYYDAFVTKLNTHGADILRAKILPDADPSAEAVGAIISAHFTNFFYIESDTRECGIRVDKPGHGLTKGMRADVAGTMRTNSDGERYIEATTATRTPPPNDTGSVEPLAMPNRSAGGGDWNYDPVTKAGQKGVKDGAGLNNIGLLVKVWGKFTKTSGAMFTINDGSPSDVKCLVPGTVTLDPLWKYVVVTGVVSCEKDGNGDIWPLIRVRERADIQPLP